ncbi:MAG: Ig domain-containing protein [Paludibacteraceae bacterium]|nr:Ig domain-containing protein [Paludibacteraceae bacterium]
MFKYHAGNAAIKPYKAGTVGAVYVYVYVRPYTEPIIPAAEGVSLDQTTLDFYVGDADVTLKATVTPSGADQAVIWESSNTAVATVSTSGKVHAVAKGTATITAKVKSNESLKAECAVTVNEKEDPTAIEAVGIKGRATKVLREGQVIIIREEKEYDVVGRQLK